MKSIITLFLLLASAITSHAQHKPGSLDSSFGTNGMVIDSFVDGNMMFAYDIQLQPDGKIVTVGSSLNRYLPDGSPDLTFGTNGRVWLPSLRPGIDMSYANDFHVRPNGKIAVVGRFDSVFYHQGCIIQFLPDGKLDSSFGVNGYAFVHLPDLHSSKMLSDGSIIVVANYEYLYLDKIKSNGTYDSSFGTNGMASAYSGHYDGIHAYADTTSNGKIIIAGIGYDAGWSRSAMLMRFLANGIPDSSFGTNGKIYYFNVSFCRDMATQPDGKIIGAFGDFGGTDFVRFKTDGAIDSSFGTNGAFTVPYRTGQFKLADSGKIYCTGDDGDFMVSKIKADGRGFDSSFGSNGTVRTSITLNDRDRAYALCIQPNGKVIAAGESVMDLYYGTRRVTMVRYYDTLILPTTNAIPSQRFQNLCLYPNPAGAAITLTGISPHQFGTSYQIVNSTGQVVQQGMLPQALSHTLSIGVLPAGLYYLRLPCASLPFLKH